MIIQCCVCKKYKEKGFFKDIWLHYAYPFKNVSHGYCTRCFKVAMTIIKKGNNL